jgi:hypothetical protein
LYVKLKIDPKIAKISELVKQMIETEALTAIKSQLSGKSRPLKTSLMGQTVKTDNTISSKLYKWYVRSLIFGKPDSHE